MVAGFAPGRPGRRRTVEIMLRDRFGTILAAGLLVASAAPMALLLADVDQVLNPPASRFADSGTTYTGSYLPGDESSPTDLTTRLGTAVSTVSVAPTLIASTFGLVVLASLSLVGVLRRDLRVPTALRIAGVVVAGVVALVAAGTTVGVALGLQFGTTGFDSSYAVSQAPLLGPLLFTAVLSATAGVALLRPGRR